MFKMFYVFTANSLHSLELKCVSFIRHVKLSICARGCETVLESCADSGLDFNKSSSQVKFCLDLHCFSVM